MISPARGGPMVKIPTVEPGFCSFKRRACSNAFKSSGLKIAGRAARFTVPSAVIASLPTFLVSGTCLASTTIFKLIFKNGYCYNSLKLLVFGAQILDLGTNTSAKVPFFCLLPKYFEEKMHKLLYIVRKT